MHYYQHHISDYIAHTSHLTIEEDCAYRRLLEQYYLSESPLPLDVKKCARLIRMSEKVEIVEAILDEFFTKTDHGFEQKKCESEIKKFKKMEKRNQKNGAKGGRPRRAGQASHNPVGSEWVSKNNPVGVTMNHKPLTINQEPDNLVTGEGIGSGVAPPPNPPAEKNLNFEAKAFETIARQTNSPAFLAPNWIYGYAAQKIPEILSQRKDLTFENLKSIWLDALLASIQLNKTGANYVRAAFEGKVRDFVPGKIHATQPRGPTRQTRLDKIGTADDFAELARRAEQGADPWTPQ